MKQLPLKYLSLFAVLAMIIGQTNVHAEETVFSATGATAGDIAGTVDAFRATLGDLNPNEPVNFTSGRRQINWDAAPDSVSAPNAFPGDFFNFNASPRARGIEFSTPGNGFQLSATVASAEGIDFTNINSQYDEIFEPFSAERLFTPIDSNITDVHFFDPADQTTPAGVSGFGVVFSDVDFFNTTSIELFDLEDNSLGTFFAENFLEIGVDNSNEHFSFLGISYSDLLIGRAQITTGTLPLGGIEDLNNSWDLVTIDDVIFGEPTITAIPEPGISAVLLLGFAAVGGIRRRRFPVHRR